MIVKTLIYTLLFPLLFNGLITSAQDSSATETIHPVHQIFLEFLETLGKDSKPFYFSACLLGKEDHNYDETEDKKIYAFLVSQFVL